MRKYTIGTRGSPLALEQARKTQSLLSVDTEMLIVNTSGDRFSQVPLGETNPPGFFTKEIEQELLQNRIDFAIHSLKDLPTCIPEKLCLAAYLKRDTPSDILLIHPHAASSHEILPLAMEKVIGVSSRRRSALLNLYRPDLKTLPIRGNIETRIDKVRRGNYDATILSAAGLERIEPDFSPLLAYELNPRKWPCAPGQSIIAVETRQNDCQAVQLAKRLNDPMTCQAAQIERSLLMAYGGGCHSPFGAYCELSSTNTSLFVAAPYHDNSFGVEFFTAYSWEQAKMRATEWIQSGRPRREQLFYEEWLYRPLNTASNQAR